MKMIILLLLLSNSYTVFNKNNSVEMEVLQLENSTFCQIFQIERKRMSGKKEINIIPNRIENSKSISMMISGIDTLNPLVLMRLVIQNKSDEWFISGISFEYDYDIDYNFVVSFCFENNNCLKAINPDILLNNESKDYIEIFRKNVDVVLHQTDFDYFQYLLIKLSAIPRIPDYKGSE
jgi:hypothetical protein